MCLFGKFLDMLLSRHSEKSHTAFYGCIQGLLPYQMVVFVVVGLSAVFQELLANAQTLTDIKGGCFMGGERRVLFD